MLTRPRRQSAAAAEAGTTDLLRLRVAAGLPPTDVAGMSDRCVRAVAVATAVGAPLLDAIDGALAAEDDARRARRAVTVASAQTRVVAAGLLIAPLVLVPGLGRLVNADLVGFYTTGAGAAVLAVGGLLLAAGAAGVAVLVRRVRRPRQASARGHLALVGAAAAGWLAWRLVGPVLAPLAALAAHHLLSRRIPRAAVVADLDEVADLTATALSGGVAAPHALRVAAGQLPGLAPALHRLAFDLELGLRVRTFVPSGRDGAVTLAPRPAPLGGDGRQPEDGLARLRAVLVTAADVGAPVVPTLRRLATDLRAEDLAQVLASAERLPAQLTFPTALCLLPATVLLIGAPIVHAGIAAAGM